MAIRAAEASAMDAIGASIRRGAHREALTACAEAHGEALGRFCMALLGNQAEAEETAQDVLLAAYRAMGDYRGEGSVRSWLFGIARRQCAKRLTKRTRRAAKLHLVRTPDPDADTPASALEVQRRAEKVRDALAALKPSEREAVALRYQAGLDYAEIALAMDIAEPAARKRVSRGLARLRKSLSPEALR